MSVIKILIAIVLLLQLIVTAYFWLYRNTKVYKFEKYLIDLANGYISRHEYFPFNSPEDPYNWFVHKYTHEEMVCSFKALKLENWFSKEEIDKILN